MCSVILLQKMSSRINSHELTVQGTGAALPTQHLCSSFKSSFIPKNHHTPVCLSSSDTYKQNPHTEMSRLAVTAKILSQSRMQLPVASVALHHYKHIFKGCMKDFPGLFNIQFSSEHRSYFDS
jgi:hypothetical protein